MEEVNGLELLFGQKSGNGYNRALHGDPARHCAGFPALVTQSGAVQPFLRVTGVFAGLSFARFSARGEMRTE